MEKKPHKVLITTSGIGAPLADITNFTNKSLIKIGKRPVISYIIEAYPKNTEFVITIGHFGDQVRDFLRLAYPDRNIRLVTVDKYQGEGSSLAYSMLQAAPYLRQPFIYHAGDTIVEDKIPMPTKNWVGGFRGEGSSQYSSFNVVNKCVQEMHEKGMINPDYLYIGLAGVYDSEDFWKIMKILSKDYPTNESLGDVHVIQEMLQKGHEYELVEFHKWYDIGNVESLHKTREDIGDSFRILHKSDESIFIFDKFVIKFFADEKIVSERVARGKLLKGLVPTIEGSAKNFYRYKYSQGKLYSKVATPIDFTLLLLWAKKYLWKPVKEVNIEEFKKVCYSFYCTKTIERVEKFLNTRKVKDTEVMINGETVPTIKKMLKRIDYDELCTTEQTNFHGDFILDNILKNKKGYVLLDWRQNFGGLLRAGDLYYDLAKLNHNLIVNHEIVNNNLFSINVEKNVVTCDILCKDNLVRCQKALFDFLEKNNYNRKKVKILTAIIWLNMSPLHHHPFDLFLYYYGKLNLWRALNEK